MIESDNLETLFFILGGSLLAALITYVKVRMEGVTYLNKDFRKFLLNRKLEKIYKPYLSKYFTLYNSLDEKGKKAYERRVQKFIDIKKFIPRGGLRVVTPEMKAMIAGAAIQVTYGYPRVYFSHFWRILIYPDNYYSTITHKYHKGEVNLKGLIVLSWRSLKEGFEHSTDGVNLGFHEMAHALRLENIIENDDYNFYDRRIMDAFEEEARIEMHKAGNAEEGSSFFRSYGITNIHEFFSVAVECFFEQPIGFREYNPKLYNLLSAILKIDTCAIYRSR